MFALLSNINWALIAPLLVIQFLLIIIALIDWFKTPMTNGPRWLWVPIILFITMIGPILYFVIGRRED